MMCEVMPTISEAEGPQGGSGSQGSSSPSQSDADSHFEQLMISILEERDHLLDMLRETQETLALTQGELHEGSMRPSICTELSDALACQGLRHCWLVQVVLQEGGWGASERQQPRVPGTTSLQETETVRSCPHADSPNTITGQEPRNVPRFHLGVSEHN
ncbi:unnamed protein product [Rangifer tarandus platyrhynchus]|uniref:Uncharacterized protein n=2 Tax=Rangifer tarandus platyrhynchus TaxID=3082113 RepID=A0ABN8ZJ73_RANTA|nr:unnamed protein product [Rangifer tarandus platyrhynchus]CAI9706130.1 unnamed protein product [Rangifer tarandus platyrhynchus]